MAERFVCINLNEEFQLTTLDILNSDTDTEFCSNTMTGTRNARKRKAYKDKQDGHGIGRGEKMTTKKRNEVLPLPQATQTDDDNSRVQRHKRKRRDDYVSEEEESEDDGSESDEESDDEEEDDIMPLRQIKKKKSIPRNVTASSPAHDISLLSEFSKYKVQITPEMEKRIKQLESAQQEMALVKTEVNELKMKIKDYECQIAIYEMTKGSKKKRDKKDMDPASQQMLMEAKAIFCSKIGRVVKFPGPGWKLYSEEDKTICGMMLPHINFPSDSTSAQKTVLWNEVVVPELGRILSDHKNKITQLMRKQHDGELTIDDDNANVNMHLTISLQCS